MSNSVYDDVANAVKVALKLSGNGLKERLAHCVLVNALLKHPEAQSIGHGSYQCAENIQQLLILQDAIRELPLDQFQAILASKRLLLDSCGHFDTSSSSGDGASQPRHHRLRRSVTSPPEMNDCGSVFDNIHGSIVLTGSHGQIFV